MSGTRLLAVIVCQAAGCAPKVLHSKKTLWFYNQDSKVDIKDEAIKEIFNAKATDLTLETIQQLSQEA